MATLPKVLNNLDDIKSAGVLHFASELSSVEGEASSGIAQHKRYLILAHGATVKCSLSTISDFSALSVTPTLQPQELPIRD